MKMNPFNASYANKTHTAQQAASHATPASSKPPAKAPPNDETVSKATDYIKHKLDDSGWFDIVSTGDLKKITAKLASLTPSERNAVISKLSDGNLHKWADKIGAPWIDEGLNGDQKSALFDMLVPSLDPKNLARLGVELTNARPEVAKTEFIMAVASKASQAAEMNYEQVVQDRTVDGENINKNFDAQSNFLALWHTKPAVQVNQVLNGNLDHRALVRLTQILQGHTPDERAVALDPQYFGVKQMAKLAQALTNQDPGMNLNKSEKSKLFDALCSSLSGRQIADFQEALVNADFTQAVQNNIDLQQKTHTPQSMPGVDSLDEELSHVTNPQTLKRLASDPNLLNKIPGIKSVTSRVPAIYRFLEPPANSVAKTVAPYVPELKAVAPPAPRSSDGELLLKSLINVSKNDPKKKMDFMSFMAKAPDDKGLRKEAKDYHVDLAEDMVAKQSIAAVFNSMTPAERKEFGSDIVDLTAKLADRQTRLQASSYFNPEFSTHANNATEALSVVGQAAPFLDRYSKQFGVPKALLSGILASEIQFDTDVDVSQPLYATILTSDDGAFKSHGEAAADSILYLNKDGVRNDLKAAHLDGVTDFLDSAPIQKFLAANKKSGAQDLYTSFPNGDMGTKYAVVTALALAHQMWTAGQKNPATHMPANFGDFLKHMSAPQMASIFGAYRAGASAEKGFTDFDASKGIYKVQDGEKLAASLHDPRAAMGVQAYQSEPYFDYFTSVDKPQKPAH